MSAICIRCNTTVPDDGVVVDPGCGHIYDVNCLNAMLAGVLKGQLDPPHKCCNRPVELRVVMGYLNEDIRQGLKDRDGIIALSDTLRPKWCDGCNALLALGAGSVAGSAHIPCDTCSKPPTRSPNPLMRNARWLPHTSTA
ncbi:hypothetical protein C8T65DRAFT_723690 [Cerioporus squamosus]|nr:hypothetical protein C8T65DRAFT_723690 [Cerioporus squamosus]